MTDAPQVLTPAQAAVATVTEAFGWDVDLKAGHAASFAKRLRTAKHLSLPEFVETFNRHYGRRDPGAGEWWAYRELYPLNKVSGSYPTPQMVTNTWGRWDLPTAVNVTPRGGAAELLAYAMERRNGNAR